MSLIKIGAVQIGQSNTASNNFHWRNLLDGLLRLSRGNAGDASPTDVMRVKADNSVEFPGGVASGVLGAGQTWQNVTGSRAAGVNYTNTTGRPIMLMISIRGGSGDENATLNIGGVVISLTQNDGSGDSIGPMSAVIPAGSAYSLQLSIGTIQSWSELR